MMGFHCWQRKQAIKGEKDIHVMKSLFHFCQVLRSEDVQFTYFSRLRLIVLLWNVLTFPCLFGFVLPSWTRASCFCRAASQTMMMAKDQWRCSQKWHINLFRASRRKAFASVLLTKRPDYRDCRDCHFIFHRISLLINTQYIYNIKSQL